MWSAQRRLTPLKCFQVRGSISFAQQRYVLRRTCTRLDKETDMPGAAVSLQDQTAEDYGYLRRATPYVVLACATASCGGLLFGYDLGISGGVTSMDGFLQKFFPHVLWKSKLATTDNYCKFDSQLVTLFTSSLYLGGFITSLAAASFTRAFGRRMSMVVGGLCFLVGSVLCAVALNLGMLIVGRIVLGVGLGFTTQSVPLYLSEMAPPKLRGGLLAIFQMTIIVGGVTAFLVNYGTVNIVPWGWRLSLGLAFGPATIITVGAFFLADSPSSLVERGYLQEGRAILQAIRGLNEDIERELKDIAQAAQTSRRVQEEGPWRTIFSRRYRPQLVMAFAIPFFQQVTGINMITFYSPLLFKTIGFGSKSALYSAVILGGVCFVATVASSLMVDKIGRRKIFIIGGACMCLFLVLTGGLLQWKLKAHNELTMPYSTIALLLICLFVISFAWSWGPLAWLVPSEIFPLEIRPAGQSINVCVILFFVFATAQAFLAMLCHFKAGIFYFFGGWVLVMTIFIYYLFPETSCIPLEEIAALWKHHTFWKRFYE